METLHTDLSADVTFVQAQPFPIGSFFYRDISVLCNSSGDGNAAGVAQSR